MDNFDVPVTVYRGTENRVVHSQKQHDQAASEGFGAYVHQEYPRIVYGDAGETMVAKSKAHEDELAGKGFNRVVTAKPVAPAPATPAPQGASANPLEARVITLEVQLANLVARVDAIQGDHHPQSVATEFTEDAPYPGDGPKTVQRRNR